MVIQLRVTDSPVNQTPQSLTFGKYGDFTLADTRQSHFQCTYFLILLFLSSSEDKAIKSKLMQLECYFTWGLEKEAVDLDNLVQRLLDSIRLPTGKVRSFNFLAYVKYLQGCNEDALAYLKQAEDYAKKDHEDEFEKWVLVSYGNYAWLYYHMGDISKAQDFLSQIEDICKNIPSASHYSAPLSIVDGEKGWCYLRFARKYYKEAIVYFQKALEQEPDDPEWNKGYAMALYRTESFDTISMEESLALKQLKHAMELNPEDAHIVVLLGLKLIYLKQRDEGIKLIEKALTLDPDEPYVTRYVAKGLRNTGCVDESINLLKRALEKMPNSAFLHHQIGLCYRDKIFNLQTWLRRPFIELSIQHLEKAFELKQFFFNAQLELAKMYALSKDFQKAEELFQKACEMQNTCEEDIAMKHRYYGDFLFKYKQPEVLAVKQYKAGLSCTKETQDKERCLQQLENIAERRIGRCAKDGEAYGLLGLVHQHRKQEMLAIGCFEKALLYDPGNEDYLSALCELWLKLE
ncbi:interferon-induced protein with tetratricopeptide repeats 5-like [Polypterus senegalus]|uniref:interferon-induced protein with tetratricopeptide repeats 5-like n=1 Tax=Polypterus senegalus TaxID=55291 RepID=UPI0019653C43|nr:interferon-induced protein with tetratricopeptide repeats 5-like [Polypterus senegalus]